MSMTTSSSFFDSKSLADAPPKSARLAVAWPIDARLRCEHRRILRRFEMLAGTCRLGQRPPFFHDLRSELLSYARAKMLTVYPALGAHGASVQAKLLVSSKECSELIESIDSARLVQTDRLHFAQALDHVAWKFQTHTFNEEQEFLPMVVDVLSREAMAALDATYRQHKARILRQLSSHEVAGTL